MYVHVENGVAMYKNMHMEHSCASAARSFNPVGSLIVEVGMECYFRPIAHSGSQPPPSGSESLECSSSQVTHITNQASKCSAI